MPDAIIIQEGQMAVETEATEGTAETLVAADVFISYDNAFTPSIALDERNDIRATLSRLVSISGEESATISFMTELKGSGSAGVAPAFGESLIACGFAETIVGGVSVTYLPASDSVPSVTVGMKEGTQGTSGLLYQIAGGRGNVAIELQKGMKGRLIFTFTGGSWAVTTAALLAGVSYSSILPPAFLSASFTMHAFAAMIENLTFDMGNVVALRNDVNAASGNLSALLTGRRPTGTFDPELVILADHDYYGRWRSGVEASLSTVLGSTPGNIVTVTAPATRYSNVQHGDRDGIRLGNVDFELNLSSGDDEFSLAFT